MPGTVPDERVCPDARRLTSGGGGSQRRVLIRYKGVACIIKRRNNCHEKNGGIDFAESGRLHGKAGVIH